MPATIGRTILEARGAANQGGATTEELFEILTQGGYDFGEKPTHAMRNMAISIGKNMLFQRTPTGLWGLREWYGGSVKKRSPQSKDDVADLIGDVGSDPDGAGGEK